MSETTTAPESKSTEQTVQDAPLGEGGLKALNAERDARAAAETARVAAEKEAADLKAKLDAIEQSKMTELEKVQKAVAEAAEKTSQLEKEIAARDLQILKQNIGAEFKLPPELVGRLQGADEAALRADAKSLAEIVPDSPFPKADPSQGAKGAVVGGTNADRFASFLDAKLN